ncbi:CPBP family intramembrane glutamic endopeptidase [Mucilaginibacter terrae]|uniref:CPBP family intramembrane glutamic endopeptidase n=1 Tax=Mucilaginibacter terrae TaxID=1955052 RepID=UPI003636C04E
MITEKPQYEPHLTPPIQLAIFFAVLIILLFTGYFIGQGIVTLVYGAKVFKQVNLFNLTSLQSINGMWIMQITSTTIPILLTPILFGKFVMRDTEAYTRTSFKFPLILLMIVFSVMMMSAPIMEVLIALNQKMVLPDFLKGVERWMRASEQAAQKATTALLKMNDWIDLVKAVLLVGLVTAIAEELMFRGCLQTIFTRWTQNTHVAIWITAALFSAFHMEFFGFLPRLMLGVFFGYFTAWSGSVWPAVWAHFLNNGTAVVMTYLFQHKQININPDEAYSFNYSLYILSILITVALFWSYRNAALQKNDLQRH